MRPDDITYTDILYDNGFSDGLPVIVIYFFEIRYSFYFGRSLKFYDTVQERRSGGRNINSVLTITVVRKVFECWLFYFFLERKPILFVKRTNV